MSVKWREDHTTEGITHVTTYAYDAAHRLATLGYPGGREVHYTYDAVGRLSEVVTPIAGSPQILAGAVTWRADGRLTGRSFGNGLRETRAYDTRGQLRAQQLGTEVTTYAYDPAGNLLARSRPGADRAWDYDALDRVIGDRLDTRERSYAYDPNHNRRDALIEGLPEAYRYAPASNRLTAIATPSASRTLTQDAAGNLLDDGAGQTYTYNQAGRLASADTAAGTTRYRYNALGLRTHKAGATTTLFHHDAGGRLLAETTADGTLIRSYVWFGDEPLAQLDGPLGTETPTYLHPDHLATPRLGTDQAGIPVWRWESPAFGEGLPSLQLRTVNLRFPGQYYDTETGLHQNWHRDYDPHIGRYVQSDPVGVAGGLNTFLYANASATRLIDPYGLDVMADIADRAAGLTPDAPADKNKRECVTRCVLIGEGQSAIRDKAIEKGLEVRYGPWIKIVWKKIQQIAGPVGWLYSLYDCNDDCDKNTCGGSW